MKFTEDRLEQVVIELFEAEGCRYLCGEEIHKTLLDKTRGNYKNSI